MPQTTTVAYATLNDGACTVEYTYDDNTLLITTVIVSNTGESGTIYASIYTNSPYALIWGPETVAFGTGTVSYDVSSAGYKMVPTTNKAGQTVYGLPVSLNVAWTAA